jgi:hypothetical protein
VLEPRQPRIVSKLPWFIAAAVLVAALAGAATYATVRLRADVERVLVDARASRPAADDPRPQRTDRGPALARCGGGPAGPPAGTTR